MEFVAAPGRGELLLPPVLILPALSIGNVGQLATDLLISSRTLTRAGYLDDPFLLPCIGNDPFGPEADGTLAVSLEVFEDGNRGLAIVQQRSPVVKGKMIEFAEHVADWAESTGIKEVIILSGLDSGKRQRRDMVGCVLQSASFIFLYFEGPMFLPSKTQNLHSSSVNLVHMRFSPQIHYISSVTPDGSDVLCDRLGWKQLAHVSHGDSLSSSDILLKDENYYGGSPFASLYSSCKARGLKALCLLTFCSEGDNTPDAFFVAQSLDQFLQQKHGGDYGTGQWKIPLSWMTIYGPPPDASIF